MFKRIATAATIFLLSLAAHADSYEASPTIAAITLFPGVPLSGPGYRIEESVTSDGFLTTTRIESDHGPLTAVGPGMLAVRLQEIDALNKLETFESAEVMKAGAKESAAGKYAAVKQLYDNPGEAASGLSEGVSRFFKRSYRAAKTGLQKADDIVHERSPGAGDEPGPGALLPGAETPEAVVDSEDRYAKYKAAAQATGGVAVDLLGFDDARRKLAKHLRIDPYTTNRALDEKLDEVTWSIFAGDLGIDLVTSLIPGSFLISSSSLVTDWVWDTPPGDLRVKIEQTLLDLGITQEDVDRLLRHRYYPLSYQAAFTTAMESLSGTPGLSTVMPLALTVTHHNQARFVINSLRMLAQYHHTKRSLASMEVSGTVVARDKSGVLVVAAPVDYLSWSEALDGFSSPDRFEADSRELHISGIMTDTARSQLQARGWQLHQNSPLLVGTGDEAQ